MIWIVEKMLMLIGRTMNNDKKNKPIPAPFSYEQEIVRVSMLSELKKESNEKTDKDDKIRDRP